MQARTGAKRQGAREENNVFFQPPKNPAKMTPRTWNEQASGTPFAFKRRRVSSKSELESETEVGAAWCFCMQRRGCGLSSAPFSMKPPGHKRFGWRSSLVLVCSADVADCAAL